MINIDNRSQNVEQEEQANANNTTATEGALTAKSIFESCRKNKTKPHAFSKAVAETNRGELTLGWASALVLRYLSSMVRSQGIVVSGKKHARINLDHIASQYPYLGRTTVDEAIQRLIHFGACEAENHNFFFGRPSYDRTRCYHVPQQWMNLAEIEIRYFHPALATAIGVPAAVVHYNFTHWIDELARKGKEQVFCLAPATLVTLQPFSKSTIKRAIKTLLDEELIYPVRGNRCLYASEPIQPNGSKADEIGSNPDKDGSKADETGSKAYNNSYCSSFVVSLEESSKERPSVAANALPNDKINNGYKDTSLEHIEFLAPFETYVPTDLLLPETKNDSLPASNTNLQIIDCDKSTGTRVDFTNSDIEPVLNPKFPIIEDFDHLHAENRNIRSWVNELTKDKATEEMFQDKAHQLTSEFFYKLGKETADDLYDNASEEELFNDLFPRYRDWSKPSDSELFDIFYYGVFECIIGAFRYATHGFKQLHPMTCFIPIAYDQYCIMLGRAEKRRLAANEAENAELQEQFASIDQHKEWMPELSPAEKARVFKQGLYSRNKVGWICLGGERKTDQIVINSTALRDVEKLFTLNPDACPADLLRIMDQCMKLHATYPPVPTKYRGGMKWHARMGHKLFMFTRHLETIIRQLGIGSAFTRFIGDERGDCERMDAEPALQEAA